MMMVSNGPTVGCCCYQGALVEAEEGVHGMDIDFQVSIAFSRAVPQMCITDALHSFNQSLLTDLCVGRLAGL